MGRRITSTALVVLALATAACTALDTGVPTATSTLPRDASPTAAPAPTSTVPAATVTVDWEAIRTSEWLIYGPDGIFTSTGALVWTPNVALGNNSLFRDGSGGLVWNDLDGLWWLPPEASQPTLVLEGQVDLLGVTPTSTGPVAQVSLSEWVDLRTGTETDPPENPRLRAGNRRPPVWYAANGLSATVTWPEVVYDNEGQPTEVVEPARLIVTNADSTIVDFPVGSFYSPWVRLHDFDGQRLIISRGPSEPALPEETFFVVDLPCG